MRRQDKKISDPNLIERVIQKGTVVHIAMMDGDKPY
jgi:nitroimidazol reductase NimA-like FMN-containing flavoprotein (pyridoxamine 5'-phosphate oxidase superfamily)